MPGSHLVLRGDARWLPIANGSVHLIVTSPPYWAQRSYRDNGGHYDGQIGSEPHPRHWLEAMFEVMKECWRVLDDKGSIFVNLGDKRAGSGGHNNAGVSDKSTLKHDGRANPQPVTERELKLRSMRGAGSVKATRRNAPDRYEQAHFGRRKSRQLLPERFAIGCEDGLGDCQRDHLHDFSHWLMPFGYGAVEVDGYWQPEPCQGIGWIVRQVICWQKANGLPESVTDRTRDDFEVIYHLVKSERYFAAIDEIREPHAAKTLTHRGGGTAYGEGANHYSDDLEAHGSGWGSGEAKVRRPDPRGALPGSVWRIASEPLRIPDWAKERYNLPDHFAAFPTEIPRRLILGFSPNGICTACNEPRRPVVDRKYVEMHKQSRNRAARQDISDDGFRSEGSMNGREVSTIGRTEATITGYACRCTPKTSHRGKRGDWKAGREESAEHGNAFGAGSGNAVPRRPGGFGTKIPPPELPMTEYHLAGWTPPPTRPSIVLDVFGGTGTTALVAETLGRTGVTLDLSEDYCRLAKWRIEESQHGRKAEQRTWGERQGTLL